MAIRSSKKKIKNLLTNFSLELILFLVNRLFNDSLVFCPMDEIKIKLKYSFFLDISYLYIRHIRWPIQCS